MAKAKNLQEKRVESMIKFLEDESLKEMREKTEENQEVIFTKMLSDSSWKPISKDFQAVRMRMEDEKGQSTPESIYLVDKRSGYSMPLPCVNVRETIPTFFSSPFLKLVEKDGENFAGLSQAEEDDVNFLERMHSSQFRHFISAAPRGDGEHCKFAYHKAGLMWSVLQKFLNVFQALFTFNMLHLWMNRKYTSDARRIEDDEKNEEILDNMEGNNYWYIDPQWTDERLKKLKETKGVAGLQEELGLLMGTHLSRYMDSELLEKDVYTSSVFFLIPPIEVIRAMMSKYRYVPSDLKPLSDFLKEVYHEGIKLVRENSDAKNFFTKNSRIIVNSLFDGTEMYEGVVLMENVKNLPKSHITTLKISFLFHRNLWQCIMDAVDTLGWGVFEISWNSYLKNLFVVEFSSLVKTGIKNHIFVQDLNLNEMITVALQNLANPLMTREALEQIKCELGAAGRNQNIYIPKSIEEPSYSVDGKKLLKEKTGDDAEINEQGEIITRTYRTV